MKPARRSRRTQSLASRSRRRVGRVHAVRGVPARSGTIHPARAQSRVTIEVCILAGGKSRRMGTDKAALRWKGRSFLTHMREVARRAGFGHRAIRKDRGPSRGPLSGIQTGLLTTRSSAVLFLPCDMPLLLPSVLRRMASRFRRRPRPLFASTAEGLGFPLILPLAALHAVRGQLASGVWSLQELARALRAATYRIPPRLRSSLANLNTPSDLVALEKDRGLRTLRLVSQRGSK